MQLCLRGLPSYSAGGRVDLCAQANHNCCRLLRVSPAMQPSTLVSARNRLFQWGELSGREVPCGDGDLALPLLAEVLGISMLHPLAKLSCSSYGMGLTEPLLPTSCTTQISCPEDHAQQRAAGWKSSGAPSTGLCSRKGRGGTG